MGLAVLGLRCETAMPPSLQRNSLEFFTQLDGDDDGRLTPDEPELQTAEFFLHRTIDSNYYAHPTTAAFDERVLF